MQKIPSDKVSGFIVVCNIYEKINVPCCSACPICPGVPRYGTGGTRGTDEPVGDVDAVAGLYAQEDRLVRMITTASWISLLISVIGILGLVYFETQKCGWKMRPCGLLRRR